MTIEIGVKLKQIVNANYLESYVDYERALYRAIDQFAGGITVLDIDILDPSLIVGQQNGDAYYSGVGAVAPFLDQSINVWRTDVTIGESNTPVADYWETYPVIEGWLIYNSVDAKVYRVRANLNLRSYPFDQPLNTTDPATFSNIKSGSYTPTLDNLVNMTVLFNYPSFFTRVGNYVTVVGRMDLQATIAGDVSFTTDLPFQELGDLSMKLSGLVTGTDYGSGYVVAFTPNFLVPQVLFNLPVGGGVSIFYTYTYEALA